MDRGPCTGSVCGRSGRVTGDAARHPTEELTRQVVEDGIRRYCAARRERIQAVRDQLAERRFVIRRSSAGH
jgi:hypothetical protein